jgi:DNA-binding response OmpR family regulator
MEDNEDINLLTKATLSYKGYNVLSALNGTEGIELLQHNDVDLVILDVMMPDIDGYEVLEIMKCQEKTKDIPVVFLSAKTQEDEIKRGIKLGALRYFTKPFDPMKFLTDIEKILDEHCKNNA